MMPRLLPVVMTLMVVNVDLATTQTLSNAELTLKLRQLTTRVNGIENTLDNCCCSTNGQTNPKSCADVRNYYTSSGVYTLTVNNRDIKVFCDQTTAGGGWTVIQRRVDEQEDFYRTWADYENGFGDLNKEFWLGLRNIYQMTSSEPYSLRVDLEDFDGSKAYAEYRDFSISGPGDSYRLSISGYSGTAGDSFTGTGCTSAGQNQNNQPFSTRDRDNNGRLNCAKAYTQGGGWFNNCGCGNPNGVYSATGVSSGAYNGVRWDTWKGGETKSYKHVEMKIRPRR